MCSCQPGPVRSRKERRSNVSNGHKLAFRFPGRRPSRALSPSAALAWLRLTLVAPQQPLSMATSYTVLAAWAADAHAKIELIDKDACWTHVIALTDADAVCLMRYVRTHRLMLQASGSGLDDYADARMLQMLQRMERILQQRVHLGAALVQQRFSTDAALGCFSVLTHDERLLVVRLAGERATDLAAIARTSSSFRAHVRTAAVANDQAWAAQAASLRLLTSLNQLNPLPPGSLCELYLRYKRFERPPPPEAYPGGAIVDCKAGGNALLSTQYDLSDFLIFVEFWWDGKLFGATCCELGRNTPVRQMTGNILEVDIGNVFGPEYREVPFCFAHDTDRSNLDWETCFLRIFVCDRTSYTTRLVYVGGLDDGHLSDGEFSVFESGRLVKVESSAVENEQGDRGSFDDTMYTVCPSLDENTLPLKSSETPLGGRLRLEFSKRKANIDLHARTAREDRRVGFSPAELASVLAVLTRSPNRHG